MRTILHVDMDAFYASVEARDRPELRARPLIVGVRGGRGVVIAASYAVRRFGVHSAMPMSEALRRCPDAICIPPRMARYREVSARVFAILGRFTPQIEGLSLDEAFLDVTRGLRLFGGAEAIAAGIRIRIAADTGLSASVGIGPNKLVAKIASDLCKPDGVCRIAADELHRVLDPLPIEKLMGVGRKSLPAVYAAGIRTFGELRTAAEPALWRAFGGHGRSMQALAAGIDERPVESRLEKSLSAEQTFAEDLRDAALIERRLVGLADRASARLRAHGLLAGRATLKVRIADFTTFTRQRALRPARQDSASIGAAARELWRAWSGAHPGAAVRLLGVGVGDLQRCQPDLFAPQAPREQKLDAAVDGIRERFGPDMLTRASELTRSRAP